eukprot:2166371-Alexandrium_andersonii.AAC.1
MWHTWEPEMLERLISRHSEVNAHMKDKKYRKGFVALVLVDDFGHTLVDQRAHEPLCAGAAPG